MIPKIFAHRGASIDYPENTLAAFREAVRVGADAIEFDIQLTRDHRIAVFHDESLDRMTGLTGRVIDWKLSTIQKVDIGKRIAPEFEGERVPSLMDVLDAVPETLLLNIHVIAYPYSRRQLITRLVHVLDQRDVWSRCIITSDSQTLKPLRRLRPEAPICSLTRSPNPLDYLRHSVELECVATQPLRQMLETAPTFIERAHTEGLAVNVVNANSEEEMRQLITMGVDGIFTDNPALLRKVLSATTST